MESLMAVNYDSYPDDSFMFLILAPSVNSIQFVKELNDLIPLYNIDATALSDLEREIKRKYGLYKSVEEITGMEYILDRGKFPAITPKGSKSIQEAYPEIQAQRIKADTHNESMKELYMTHQSEAQQRVDEDKELQEARHQLIEKYPLFKRWCFSTWGSRTIFGKFTLCKIPYYEN